PIRGIIFKPSVLRRIMRRCDHDAICESRFPAPVIGEYGMRNGWRRRIFIVVSEHQFHAVGRQYLDGSRISRHGEGMSIDAQEQGAVGFLLLPVKTNSLTDGQDMPFIKRAGKRRSAMT